MSQIRDRIGEQIKEAMKARDEARTGTLRMIKAEIIKKETAAGAKDMDEAGLVTMLNTMKKQREESVVQFEKGGRADLADKEKVEIAILDSFLPATLSDAELDALVVAAIAESGATDLKGLGGAMKLATAKAAGRADGKRLSEAVRKKLGG